MATTTTANSQRQDRVRAIADEMLEAFRTGQVPKAMAQVFIRRDPVPADKWSWGNRILIALRGHTDARGFRQWKTVGRRVKRGERAAYILGPIVVRAKKDIPERDVKEGDSLCVGFKAIPVFGYSQTEGRPLASAEVRFVDTLPLVDVARQWGIEVDTVDAGKTPFPFLGSYQITRNRVWLAVRNLATWAHELIHAADHRVQGSLRGGQHVDQEIVAELGGAILLECCGLESDADRGGCWNYLRAQAPEKTLTVVNELIERTCSAVAHVLEAAEALEMGAKAA